MAVRVYKHINQPEDDNDDFDLSKDFDSNELDDEMGLDRDEEPSQDEDQLGSDEFGDEPEEEEDPDFQGIIRTVTGAVLVYKRADDAGTFEELWMYNVGGRDIKPEMQVKRAILAGTDIDPKKMQSDDAEQKAELSTVGNVQFLHIKGLPN